MARKVKITNKLGDIIYQGKVSDMPMVEVKVKEMSFKIFKDPEPCVIHQSYAVSKLIEPLEKRIKGEKLKLKLSELDLDLSYIDYESFEDLYLEVLK